MTRYLLLFVTRYQVYSSMILATSLSVYLWLEHDLCSNLIWSSTSLSLNALNPTPSLVPSAQNETSVSAKSSWWSRAHPFSAMIFHWLQIAAVLPSSWVPHETYTLWDAVFAVSIVLLSLVCHTERTDFVSWINMAVQIWRGRSSWFWGYFELMYDKQGHW